MNVDIERIKRDQEEMNKRKKRILDKFFMFRDSFITRLDTFVAEAIDAGIGGVEIPNKSRSTKSMTNIKASINSNPIVILSSDEAFFADLNSDILASKIFFFSEGAQFPHAIAVFQEAKENKNEYFVEWHSADDVRYLNGKNMVIDPIASGEEAANRLISHYYGLGSFWRDKPSFDQIIQERSVKGSLGFPK